MPMLFADLPVQTRTRVEAPDNVNTRAWKAAIAVLTSQGGMTERRARIFIGGLMKQGLRPEDLQSLANGAQKAGTLDVVSYLAKGAHEVQKRRKTAVAVELPSEARMRAWMQEWVTNPAEWRRDIRGPMPGEPGCIIPISLQREYRAA